MAECLVKSAAALRCCNLSSPCYIQSCYRGSGGFLSEFDVKIVKNFDFA